MCCFIWGMLMKHTIHNRLFFIYRKASRFIVSWGMWQVWLRP